MARRGAYGKDGSCGGPQLQDGLVALYSDIVLPAASWYEKADLNSTDMHSFIHPLTAAIAPVWESKTDWDIFKEIARVTSELAQKHLAEPQNDIVTSPLSHDSPDEISQPSIKDWYLGECEAIPGKTMHKISVVERDYTKIYDKFIALGDKVRTNGLGAHGNHFECEDVYDDIMDSAYFPKEKQDDKAYPSLKEDVSAANVVLRLSSLTNGVLAMRAYEDAEKRTGLVLTDLAEGSQDVLLDFADLQAQPRRYNTSPLWSGLMKNGRAYAAFTYNVERWCPGGPSLAGSTSTRITSCTSLLGRICLRTNPLQNRKCTATCEKP